ncbi:ABC transporter permease [Silvibacterium dinghuense]|uniref:ABC transporter permease n=2 Tax=Silvibacterium dinghuense TaxID=1560006 RepID=A0A4Q1SF86_9BACT|nr:ABC transporter permease [Silvibacterium dinghuense]
MHTLLSQLRLTARQIRKNPGFSLTVVLTLALGIGAATGIFSLVNAVLLRPLPFPHSERLMWAEHNFHNGGMVTPNTLSYPDFFDWRLQSHSFEEMATYRDSSYTLTGYGQAQELDGAVVSSDFFRVLGVRPALGRDFTRTDEQAGQHVVVISHALWLSAFGGNPDIVGRTIRLGNDAYTVAGVMPTGVIFPLVNPAPQLWTTLADDSFDPEGGKPMTAQRGMNMLFVIGRLKEGVTPSQAQAELSNIDAHLAIAYPDTNKHFTSAVVTPELDHMVGDVRPALRMLFAAVGVLLLIACANVAGLLLARAAKRRGEIALRAALGASRVEIMRQIIVESLTLSLLGGAVGLAFSTLFLEAIRGLLPKNLPRLDTLTVDGSVLAFAIGVSVLTGLLFGVLPAWRMSKLDPSLALRDSTRSVTAGRGQQRMHAALVITETALGLVLLVAAGLFLRSFLRVTAIDPGFDKRNVLTARLDYPGDKDFTTGVVRFYDQLLPKVAALPGVRSVAAAFPVPLSNSGIGVDVAFEGKPVAPGDRPIVDTSLITPNFFHTLRIPVLEGRDFGAVDNSDGQPVAIINQAFAKKFYPNEDPVGKMIQPFLSDGLHEHPMRRIIAVVGDVKGHSLTEVAPAAIYIPIAQCAITPPLLVVRTAADPVPLIPAVRAQVAGLRRDVPLYDAHTLEDLLSGAASARRFQMVLLGAFAGMALLLAGVGLYGVLAYMVAQRANEMGLRLALGAQRGDVLRLVLQRGVGLAAVGLAIGLAVSALLTRYVASLLYGVKALDPVTYIAVALLVAFLALIASMAPAVQAARVDPISALRNE